MGNEREERLAELLSTDDAEMRAPPELRSAVAEQRAIAAFLSSMPAETAPDLTAAVMGRLGEPRPSRWNRLFVLFWAPRRLTLQWNFAMVLILGVVGGAVAALTIERQMRTPDKGTAENGLATFVFVSPEAHSVTVAGDFNGWNAATHPLVRNAGGAWGLDVQLRPGRYQYMFVVDGKTWIADPLARTYLPDGFGSRNAVLDL